MSHRLLPLRHILAAALLYVGTLHASGHAAGVNVATESLFLLPVDAPEQKVVQEAQALGLPIPSIALVPPEMVQIYAESGRDAAQSWCARRAGMEECIQALTTLQEGPFINHEKSRIWLHTSLPLSKGKSAPMLQELARKVGTEKARQVIIAHEIAHVAFRSMSIDQLESAAQSGLGEQEIRQLKKALFNDARFYEAFCNFFGIVMVARLSPEEDGDNERRRIAYGMAEALRVFYGENRFYMYMAYALDNWTLSGVSTFKTWDTLAIHATQQATRLSIDRGWVFED